MKLVYSVSTLVLLAIFSFTSCKKDYQCKCVSVNSPSMKATKDPDVVKVIEASTRKKAQTECRKDNMGTTYDLPYWYQCTIQ